MTKTKRPKTPTKRSYKIASDLHADGDAPRPLTEEHLEAIIKMIQVGGTLEDAAHYAGISPTRLERHVRTNLTLRRELTKVFAGCKRHHLKKIYDSVRGWQASAWFLERVFRKQFALNQSMEVEEERAIQLRKVVREVGIRPQSEPSPN